MNIKIISCRSGEWRGLYVNGILKYEGHEVTPRILFLTAGIPESLVAFSERETSPDEEALMEESGTMPQRAP